MCNVSGQIIIKAHEKGAEAPFIIFHEFFWIAVTINSTQRFTSTMLAPVGVESKNEITRPSKKSITAVIAAAIITPLKLL